MTETDEVGGCRGSDRLWATASVPVVEAGHARSACSRHPSGRGLSLGPSRILGRAL